MEKPPDQETASSKLYEQVIQDATTAFREKLAGHPPVVLSKEQYKSGIDALPEDLQNLTKEVSKQVGDERDYELSYSQLCSAFFAAAEELKILSVE